MDLHWLAPEGHAATTLDELAQLYDGFEQVFPDPDPPVTRAWVRAEVDRGNDVVENRFLLGRDDSGALIGGASMETWNMSSNGNIAECWLGVLPDHRRRGYARRLLAALLDEIERHGRSSLLVGGYDHPETALFWDRFGVPRVYEEQLSRCLVEHVDADSMQAWADVSTGYRIERWEGLAPDRYSAGMALVRNSINDAPMGEMAIDDFDFDEGWIEQTIAHRERLGMTTLNVVAIDTSSNQPVGHTELVIEGHRPWHAWQADTAVLPEHRGQRLGRTLKATMWQWLRDDAPAVTTITTGNAANNEHMLAINWAMGFSPWRLEVFHQADVVDVRAGLAT